MITNIQWYDVAYLYVARWNKRKVLRRDRDYCQRHRVMSVFSAVTDMSINI